MMSRVVLLVVAYTAAAAYPRMRFEDTSGTCVIEKGSNGALASSCDFTSPNSVELSQFTELSQFVHEKLCPAEMGLNM
jgi:hypothetical protein